METATSIVEQSFLVSKIANVTHSVGKFVLPSLALVATAFFTRTMALPQQSPPSLASSRSSLSFSPKQFVVPPSAKQIHLVILVHGWLGTPAEMSSLQLMLDYQLGKSDPAEDAALLQQGSQDLSEIVLEEEEEEKKEEEEEYKVELPEGTHVLVHSAECNDGKTTDGVTAGGVRVAEEVNQIIHDLLCGVEEEEGEEPNEVMDAEVSLSFIGNSLGGLYARSALADIQWDLPNGKRLEPKVFCTTCTPHLGKRGETYLPLPRFAEQGVGYMMRPTGQDLFGLNKVMENLATQAKYIDPLKRFQKRIAYANAFGTDLQVPTSTAAFLADTESPHETLEHSEPFLLKVTTPRDDKVLDSIVEATSSKDPATETTHIPSTTMARTLDAMGWTKVFCDVRDKLVSVPIPFRKFQESSSEFTTKEKWTSHELKDVVASRIVHDKKWPIPFGHTMLIANSKSEFYAKLNAGGMPFVKQMSSEFLEDVLRNTK